MLIFRLLERLHLVVNIVASSVLRDCMLIAKLILLVDQLFNGADLRRNTSVQVGFHLYFGDEFLE